MSASVDRPTTHPRSTRLQIVLAPTVLFVVAMLTALLWFTAIPTTARAVASLGADDVVQATVLSCEQRGPCAVSWPTAGTPERRVFDQPGMFALADGATVSMVERDGVVRRAGWSAVADGALLTFLALCFSGFTLGWFRRVLDTAPLMPDDSDADNVTDADSALDERGSH